MKRLPKKFYRRDTIAVARDLLGCTLVHKTSKTRLAGMIVETEAYDGPWDKASHASKRRTKRNEIMFGPAGYVYIYLIYGMYHCLNFVTGEKNYPAAVLVRALEPLGNIKENTSGPGRLCRAMKIDMSLNHADAVKGHLYILGRKKPEPRIICTPRIGVSYAAEWAKKKMRFCINGNEWVSKQR